MANTIIVQQPRHSTLPVGQDIIFAVSNNLTVANKLKVKFIAEVHISSNTLPVPGTSTHSVGTFKTTPNNAGVGMFDFRPIVESYVKADNLAAQGSKYKLEPTSNLKRHPLHLIDQFSKNTNCVIYLMIEFSIQYFTAENELVTLKPIVSKAYTVFNGYLKYSDILTLDGVDFGYNLKDFNLNGTSKKFLTNAPLIQNANLEDYGTMPFLTFNNPIDRIRIAYYDSAGGGLAVEYIDFEDSTGAYDSWTKITSNELLFVGCFPANLRGWSTTFQNLVTAGTIQGGHYRIYVVDNTGSQISDTYRINVTCPNLKGYEPIRLTWLNQWGGWDYYTFTMKSIKMISTKGSTYNQLAGTWNEKAYRIDSFKGGKKAFRVNATEKVTMNTDFVNESESQWFEELINSPEVYILEGFQDDSAVSALNQYVTPVRLTTSSYTRKTVANDKLMQYTFEVEKSKTLRTQSV